MAETDALIPDLPQTELPTPKGKNVMMYVGVVILLMLFMGVMVWWSGSSSDDGSSDTTTTTTTAADTATIKGYESKARAECAKMGKPTC